MNSRPRGAGGGSKGSYGFTGWFPITSYTVPPPGGHTLATSLPASHPQPPPSGSSDPATLWKPEGSHLTHSVKICSFLLSLAHSLVSLFFCGAVRLLDVYCAGARGHQGSGPGL